MSDKDQREQHASSLKAYEIDSDTVRVNNPDRNEPDKIVRRLATGDVKIYDAHKKKS